MTIIPDTPAAIRLVPIPRMASGGRWRVEAMRSYGEPMLLWFTRGQGRITVAGVTRGYGAHNAVFIPAGTMHGFDVSPQVHGMAVFFGRNCSLTLPDTAQHLRIREQSVQMEMTGYLENIHRELESRKTGHDRAARHHLGLMGVWIERQVDLAATDTPRPDASRRLAARYAEILERGFDSGMGVADYAAILGVTPTHLSRACKSASGRPASALLQDRVIFEARRLLSDTAMPVHRVSETLGFTSPAYFTRAFQHRTGQTPTAFRKSS